MGFGYTVREGDTFATIARNQFGTEELASYVARGNPGVSEPLQVGTNIAIPLAPLAEDFPQAIPAAVVPPVPPDVPQATPAASSDEVAIKINGKRFRFWTAVRITRAIDNLDTVEFGAPFEPDLPNFREAFRPFSYQDLEITVGGDRLFVGTLIGADPVVGDADTTVSASGYSLPGVMADCTMPASAYPIEFNEVALPAIAAKLAEPFGITVLFQGDAGAPFERVALAPGSTVLPFLVGLAKQRNFVVSSTPAGSLLFWRSAEPGEPVARLEQGQAPVDSVTPSFRPQDYFSHVTGIEQIIVGLYGSQFTVKNPQLEGVIRPTSFKTKDTAPGDVKATVEAATGRMFGNTIAYSIVVATWRDPQGKLWEPNTTITLLAPGVMVYTEYTFEIRSIVFDTDDEIRIATLNVVIPGSFSGTLPETLPWDT